MKGVTLNRTFLQKIKSPLLEISMCQLFMIFFELFLEHNMFLFSVSEILFED